MVVGALKHFAVVAVAFAFIGGGVLTIIVNNILGTVLANFLGVPPTDYYLGALFLTFTSCGLILACVVTGNRIMRKHLDGVTKTSLSISALLFMVLVGANAVPELRDA